MALLAVTAVTGRAEEPERMRDIVYGRKSGMGLIMDVLKPKEPNGSLLQSRIIL